jgi:Ca-activated chloride channel family protein
VKNSRGDLVTTLEQGAFTVYENGKPQPIVLFRNDDVPISLGILIDNSGSMRAKRGKVEAAALALVRASNPQDEVFVLNFADTAQLDVPFTSDVTRLEAGIARVDAIGGTAMRDAVDVAEGYVEEHATRERKVLLVITDGNDNASTIQEARIRARAERGQVVINAIGLLNEDDSSEAGRARHALDDLAEVTGGVTFYPDSLDDVHTVALELARQMRSQYLIAYRPLNAALDGSYRTIRVTAKGEGKLTAHTRPGYRASK